MRLIEAGSDSKAPDQSFNFGCTYTLHDDNHRHCDKLTDRRYDAVYTRAPPEELSLSFRSLDHDVQRTKSLPQGVGYNGRMMPASCYEANAGRLLSGRPARDPGFG